MAFIRIPTSLVTAVTVEAKAPELLTYAMVARRGTYSVGSSKTVVAEEKVGHGKSRWTTQRHLRWLISTGFVVVSGDTLILPVEIHFQVLSSHLDTIGIDGEGSYLLTLLCLVKTKQHSTRSLAEASHLGKSTVARALVFLQENGIVIKTSSGRFKVLPPPVAEEQRILEEYNMLRRAKMLSPITGSRIPQFKKNAKNVLQTEDLSDVLSLIRDFSRSPQFLLEDADLQLFQSNRWSG